MTPPRRDALLEKVAKAIIHDIVPVYENTGDTMLTMKHLRKLLRAERAAIRLVVRKYKVKIESVPPISPRGRVWQMAKLDACHEILTALRGR